MAPWLRVTGLDTHLLFLILINCCLWPRKLFISILSERAYSGDSAEMLTMFCMVKIPKWLEKAFLTSQQVWKKPQECAAAIAGKHLQNIRRITKLEFTIRTKI